MVAIRAADLRPAAGPRLGKDGRTALTVARPGRIATGDLVVFLKPVAVAPAVVRRDGRVQAGGHPADHARLGLAEERLDELCGSPGVIDKITRTVLLDGKVKGAARRALTPALAIRLTLLMTLMPDADYAEVMAACRSRFMASMTSISSVLICTTRMWVAMPRNSTTGSSTSAAVVVCDPPAALDSSASVLIAADSTLRKTVARLIASFQISDRNPSRV